MQVHNKMNCRGLGTVEFPDLDPSVQFCFNSPLTGSDLLCAGELPVPDMADCAGGELGVLCAILRLHRAVQRTRVQECHCE